jgi:hypothetical protein
MGTPTRVRVAVRRLVGLSLALSLAVGAAGTVRAAPTDGLLLIGTDAAYARFVAPIDECHSLDFFVGYVQADGLKSPLDDRAPRFHTDVEAQLTIFESGEVGGCGGDLLNLTGVRGIDEGDPVSVVSLSSATLDGYQLTVGGFDGDAEVSAVIVLDVAWSAVGDTYTQTQHVRGNVSTHRTVDAATDATMTVDTVIGGGDISVALALLAGDGPISLEQTEASLTNYQEIQLDLP